MVTVASAMENRQITASRGVVIVADTLIANCADIDYDLVVLPGGIPGAAHLRDSADLTRILKRQRDDNRLYGAICASPAVVLAHHGLLEGRRATCHPSHMEKLSFTNSATSRVVVDGNCLTSRGPGTAVEFALALVEQLYDKETRESVAEPMIV
jgi:4-methyl-5(b-hydroxyethyl)-thiazole monophosphate biosynthesis